jgi:hypothetical protein
MSYFADLSRCAYFDRRGELEINLIAVGWLSSGPHARGPIVPGLVEQLFDLLDTVWDPCRFRGRHECELCGSSVPSMQDAAGREVSVGMTNLFIPTPDIDGLFVAPSLVLHYIVDHGYCPPASFQTALMACPPTHDVEYFRRIGKLALPESWGRKYREALGGALARRAGWMDDHAWWQLCRQAGVERPRPIPGIPPWFEQEHLAPIRALVLDFQSRGETSDTEALRAWLDRLASSAEFFGPESPG